MFTKSQHTSDTGSRRAPIRSMLTSASLLAAATLIALGSAGTSLASWISSDNLKTPTIESGSMVLLVNGASSISLGNAGLQNMYPGSKVSQTVQLHNTGTVKSNVVATATPAASGVEVRTSLGVCPSSIGGASATDGAIALGSWNANQNRVVCVEVSLSAAAAQSATIPFTLTFTASQAGA